jgi:DNA-directed RNA polymerase specialized sigma24 family protein
MDSALSPTAFDDLLYRLDADRDRAGEKYLELRTALTRFFEWRNAPFSEEQADEVLNRVARKLSEGVQVRNLLSYCYEVARLVCLEALKGHDNKREPLDATHKHIAVADTIDEEHELRLSCLEDCLNALPPESRTLIVAYYQDDKRERIERRKRLAVTLGLPRLALANRAQRIRDKLDQCVKRCLRRKMTI